MSSLLASLLPLAQTTDLSTDLSTQAPDLHVGPVPILIGVAFMVFIVATMWKIFVKAGEPGWASIVPFYNLYILCKIGGKSGWWVLLLMIPFVNFIFAILLSIAIAERFGKGVGFGIGLAFLGVIFYPILAFGDAQYQGGAAPAIGAALPA